MTTDENYTQVLLRGDGVADFVCWVESHLARVGKLVEDDAGKRWRVAERYATWPKSHLDAQRQETNRFAEVLDV